MSNYIRSAWRNLQKNPGYSAINLAGLSLGTVCCLYILLYVRDQRSYDQQFSNSERIYRIVSDLSGIGEGLNTACVSPPIAPTMAADFGDIADWTRLVDPPEVDQNVLSTGNRTFYERKGYYVDSTFFRVFDFPFAAGKAEKCLDEPYTVVLTLPVAEKLFASAQNAIGQSIMIENRFDKHEFRVTGVIANTAWKSQFNGSFYMSMRSGALGDFVLSNQAFATQNFVYGFVKLFPQTEPAALEAKLPDFLEKHGGDQFRELGIKKILHLEPLADIHTRSDRKNQLTPTVSNRLLDLLTLLAIFVQGIACINFMNLSTARASRRAKEVGVRKALGAGRGALVGQFLGESLLLSLLAIALAVPLIGLSLPWLNQLTGAEVLFSPLHDKGIWGMVAGLVAVTGLVAGSYPAFYLSGFQPIKVLKGVFSTEKNRTAIGLRKSLVTVQFIIAIALIAGTLVFRQQFSYLSRVGLGFEKAQKIAVPFHTSEARESLVNFKQELSILPEVEAVGATTTKFGDFTARDMGIYADGGKSDNMELLRFSVCDEDYLPTMKVQMLYGRGFVQTDTFNQLIVNEQAVKSVGFTAENAVGKRVYSTFGGETKTYEIIGVLRDFNFESLYQRIKPYGFLYASTSYHQNAIISLKPGDSRTSLAKIAAVWQKLVPGLPFEFSFLEEDLQKQYAADQVMANIISAFTWIALFISCLGLLGLAAFTAEQRTKEIGIRKVLGASVVGITSLLAGDFLKIVLISFVIASPIAWWAMDKWLEDFAYRVDIQWWMFAIAGATAIAVAFLTVGFQSVRAALANPVKSLRSE